MDRVEEYIESYKKLEEAVRRVYRLDRGQSIVTELKNQPAFESLKSEIQSCADLRNYFQHNSRIGEFYAAEPTEDTIRFVRDLTARVNSRHRCREICIPLKSIIWRRMTDPVRPALEQMVQLGHSNIPILQDGRVVGVFDEHAFFLYAARTGGTVTDALTFRDLTQEISVSQRNMQSFAFASMNDWADDAAALFEKKLENGKHLRLVLLTNTGKPTDRLRGILTPWDILANA